MYSMRNSLIRQNLHPESEKLLNDCINVYLYDAYVCKSMAYYWDRDDIGMFGMAEFNRWCACQGFNNAKLIMDHITIRGGNVVFDEIKKPDREDWGTPLDSLESLLTYRFALNKIVLKCHTSAHSTHDPHLNHFIETIILRPLILFIRKLGIMIANLKRAGTGLGEYEMNKDLLSYLEDFKCVIPFQATSFSRINRRVTNKDEDDVSSVSSSESEEEEEENDEDRPSRLSLKNVIPVINDIMENFD